MKSIIPVLLLVLGTVRCASTPEPAPVVRPLQKPFLWEVSKDGRTSYLFGSLHLGVLKEELPPSFWTVFNKADNVAFETDLSPDGMRDMMSFQTKFLLRQPERPLLSDVLTIAEWQSAQSLLNKYGMPKANLDNFSAVGALAFLVMLQTAQEHKADLRKLNNELGHNQVSMLDMELHKQAASSGKVLTYLEKTDSEGLRNCLFKTEDEALADLRAHLKNPSTEKVTQLLQQFSSMITAYRAGNDEAVRTQLESHEKATKSLKCVIGDRNRKWLAQIISTHRNFDTSVIVVGVGHMIASRDSLIKLLTEKGFKVNRL